MMELLLAFGISVAASALVAALGWFIVQRRAADVSRSHRQALARSALHAELKLRRGQKDEAWARLVEIVKQGIATEPEFRQPNLLLMEAWEERSKKNESPISEEIVERLPTEIRDIGLSELLDAIADGANDPDLDKDAWLRKNRWDVALVRLRSAARWLRLRIPGRRISK